jgi:hypothetical protein
MARIVLPLLEGPVQAGTIVALPSGRESVPADLFTVPAGVRLVIEYVTFACTASVHDDHGVVRLRIGVTLRGGLVWHDIATLAAANDWSGTSLLVRIYADPGSVVHALVERVFRPPSTARISFAGQLERMPPAPPVLTPTTVVAGTAKRSRKRAV